MIVTKTCSKCKQEKTVSEFSCSAAYKDGYRGQCKRCRAGYQSKYGLTAAGREAAKKRIVSSGCLFKRSLRARYGMSVDQFYNMLDSQGGKCAICGATSSKHSKYNRLVVDHCHDTGVVRGLLCIRCNMAIAMVGDQYHEARKFVEYLRKHDSRHGLLGDFAHG